jgi:hypothetical protein
LTASNAFFFCWRKATILGSFFLLPLFCFAQGDADEAIAKTVQLYFNGMVERNPAKLEAAFLPQARLIGYRGDLLVVTLLAEWIQSTEAGAARDPAQYRNELKSIRRVGKMALVEAELYWPTRYYYDYLTLLEVDGVWKIVHKSWHEKALDK